MRPWSSAGWLPRGCLPKSTSEKSSGTAPSGPLPSSWDEKKIAPPPRGRWRNINLAHRFNLQLRLGHPHRLRRSLTSAESYGLLTGFSCDDDSCPHSTLNNPCNSCPPGLVAPNLPRTTRSDASLSYVGQQPSAVCGFGAKNPVCDAG